MLTRLDLLHFKCALDVIDQEHGRRAFELGLVDGETRYRWRFRGERYDMSMAVTHVNAGGVLQFTEGAPVSQVSGIQDSRASGNPGSVGQCCSC